MQLHDLKVLETDMLQAHMFSPRQSLAYLANPCFSACVCLCQCAYSRAIDCTEGFCVIVLSAEACREKGHVLSSDHIVYYNHNRGREIVRQKGVREESERKT